jgi:hypothetical protein
MLTPHVLSLVGTPDSIVAARQMDRAFWRCSARIRRGWKPDEDAWATVRDEMESARLEFINVARRKLTESGKTVTEVPVARLPLSELNELYGPPVDDLIRRISLLAMLMFPPESL